MSRLHAAAGSRALVVIASASLWLASGCNQPTGDFDGVAWAPMTTQFAVADRHQIIESQGVLQATQRPEAAQSMTLLLTGALANPHFEWRRSTSRTLLTLRQDLATTDGLLLYDIPLSALTPSVTSRAGSWWAAAASSNFRSRTAWDRSQAT